jgi:hypothetical protein
MDAPASDVVANDFSDSKRHREKAGRTSDAVTLYKKRKSDIRADIRQPDTLRAKEAVSFSYLPTM